MRFLPFLLRQRFNKNAGQALTFVLLIGSLMMGVGAMMLTQSQAQQKSVKDSLDISKIRNAAEIAKNRMESLFIQYPILLLYPPDFWETALLNPNYSSETREFVNLTRLCQSNQDWKNTRDMLLEYARSDDIKIKNNTFFRLINITHPENNEALITIQAQNLQGATANLQAEVRYEFYYLEGNAPALWTTSEKRIRSEFFGNVWLNNCKLPTDGIRLSEEKYKAIHVGHEFPDLPDLYEIINRIPKSHIINLDKNYNGETSFPRSHDSPTRIIKGYTIYEYVIDNFDTNQPIEIKTVVKEKPVIVIFNTKQGIKKGEITHTCGSLPNCPAENLVFINHATNINDQMCFVTDKLSAFIFSPNSGVGFTEKKQMRSKIFISGSIWTKELISDRDCGKDIELYATLTFKQIVRDFQILSPYPKITEVSKFSNVNDTVIKSESGSRVRFDPFSSLAPNSIPVFIDDELGNP